MRRKEPLDDALRRELREEVGVEPTAPPRLLGVYWNFAESKSDYVAVFVVEQLGAPAGPQLRDRPRRLLRAGRAAGDTSPAAGGASPSTSRGREPVVLAPW